MREVPGAGVEGMVDGIRIRLGSARFCGAVEMVEQTASLWLQLGNAAPMALPLGDTLRPDAEQVIRKLEAGGYVVEVLSGDTPRAVAETAAAVRISTWKAGQRPEQKIAHIAALEHQGRKVLMIGDGLNDAPALSAGHASLSPSSAADISQMAADAVFQGECLEPVIACLRTAKAARRRALENFAIAIGYNAVFVPLAMAGRVTPLIAAIAMSASSIAVTLNALRLNRGPKEARS